MKKIISFLVLLAVCMSHRAQTPLAVRLNALLADTLLRDSEVGLRVVDLTADSLLFDYQGNKLYRPASIQKIVTAVTALEFLGVEHPFTTCLYHTGHVTPDSLLEGSLYIVGGFDPLVGKADMDAFAAAVKDMGVRQINGRLIGNVSLKDTLKWGSGWCWDDDMPPLTPLLYERTDSFLPALHRSLSAQGVSVVDTTFAYTAYAPDSIMTQIAYCKRNLEELLDRMMKKSDNLHAEALFYHLASAYEGSLYATAEEGAEMMKKMIQRVGHDPKRYIMADGSGVSLYNYLSPELLADLLVYAWKQPHLFKPLYKSLPISGIDGTLKHRMKGTVAYRKIHAKTGTLTGVTSLAGYAHAANGHTLAFVIINQNMLQSWVARSWQDRVCEALAGYGGR